MKFVGLKAFRVLYEAGKILIKPWVGGLVGFKAKIDKIKCFYATKPYLKFIN